MKKRSRKKTVKMITTEEFDAKVDRGEDITPYLDWENAVVVKKVNVDFPNWMVDDLDREAQKLNVSRQAVIKMWLRDRLDPAGRKTRANPKA